MSIEASIAQARKRVEELEQKRIRKLGCDAAFEALWESCPNKFPDDVYHFDAKAIWKLAWRTARKAAP